MENPKLRVVDLPQEVADDIGDLLRQYADHAGDFRGVVLVGFSKDKVLHVRLAGNMSYLEMVGACDFAKMQMYQMMAGQLDDDG